MSYIRTSLVGLLGLLLGLLLATSVAAQDGGAEQWLAELRRNRDDADVKLIRKLGDERTKLAAAGLVDVYEQMASLYMQREIVRALGKFEGSEAEQPAFDKLALIAGNSTDPEVRDEAIKQLGRSTTIGKKHLKQLVDSEVPDEVREKALRVHVAKATPDDVQWYRYIWNPKQERRKNPDGSIRSPELSAIRLLAFEGLVPYLSEDELIEAVRSPLETDPKIRRAALQRMHERDMPKTSETAKWVLERVDVPGANRAEAARILAAREGPRAVPTFLELAKKRDVTQDDLRDEMARLIAALDDDAVKKRMMGMVGRGKPHEKVFALQATAGINDEKLLKVIRKELQDREPEVRRAAALALGKRGDRQSLPDLRNMLAKAKLPSDQRVAIDAISMIEGRNAKWLQELAELSKHAEREVRNAAVDQLASVENPKYLPVLAEALQHEDWTTRLAAIHGLVAMRVEEAVPKLIERLEKETGRMNRAVREGLWQLTGQPFESDVGKWREWWKAEGAAFKVITEAQLADAAHERELRRLRQRTVTGAKFFGIRIESHRVIFVVDVSGSMLESVYGRYVGEGSQRRGAARIDVAKQELSQCIKNLEEGAQFNILAFSSGIGRWLKEGIATSTEHTREEALEWVERLGATGATNLYDTVRMAFEDKDVDTIFIMSDGEPTSGDVIDPARIREHVAFWNKHRRIKINTISIGGTLEVLEWLAKDGGGDYVQIR